MFSIGFPFLLFLAGCKITFGKSPLPLWRTTYTTFLSMAWLSVALGCFVRSGEHDYFAGIFGSGIATVTIDATGKIATFFILLAVLLIILILCYNLSTDSILSVGGKLKDRLQRNPQKKGKARKDTGYEEDDDEKTAPAEIQDLDSLYISNQNELSDEYNNNVIEFDTDNNLKKSSGRSAKPTEKPSNDDVPFDFDISW